MEGGMRKVVYLFAVLTLIACPRKQKAHVTEAVEEPTAEDFCKENGKKFPNQEKCEWAYTHPIEWDCEIQAKEHGGYWDCVKMQKEFEQREHDRHSECNLRFVPFRGWTSKCDTGTKKAAH